MGGLGVAGPEKLAIVCGDERLTYGALTARVSQFAAGFDVPVRGEEARGEQRSLGLLQPARVPENRGEFEYRIKSVIELHERVARESELTKA